MRVCACTRVACVCLCVCVWVWVWVWVCVCVCVCIWQERNNILLGEGGGGSKYKGNAFVEELPDDDACFDLGISIHTRTLSRKYIARAMRWRKSFHEAFDHEAFARGVSAPARTPTPTHMHTPHMP